MRRNIGLCAPTLRIIMSTCPVKRMSYIECPLQDAFAVTINKSQGQSRLYKSDEKVPFMKEPLTINHYTFKSLNSLECFSLSNRCLGSNRELQFSHWGIRTKVRGFAYMTNYQNYRWASYQGRECISDCVSNFKNNTVQ